MTPADLFVELYLEAEQWDATARTLSIAPDARIIEKIQKFVWASAGDLGYQSLKSLLPSSYDTEEGRGCALTIMNCIDRLFGEIHPRSQTALSHSKEALPSWVEELEDIRTQTGEYTRLGDRTLVPRGTFCRGHRHIDASFADCLADRFASLALVTAIVQQDGRNIPVRMIVVGATGLQGVSQGTNPGRETLAAVPIAETSGEIILTEHNRAGRTLVEYQLAEGLNAATRMHEALKEAGTHDIAIAPELVMSEVDVGKLCELLNGGGVAGRVDCRMIVAGSGLSVDLRSGLAWNQTEVLNSRGFRLWRQRKIWPAGINGRRAGQYGLSSPVEGLRYECTASGDEVVIADVDGLGRCVVLICQDLEARSMSDELVRQYQPDWVFTPILDPGIEHGKWAHQRALQLGATARSRFVVCTSTALPRCEPVSKDADCLLVVGPRDVTEQDGGRRFRLLGNEASRKPDWVKCCWDDKDWPKIQLEPVSQPEEVAATPAVVESGGTG
ncbi:hypothetical protein OE648_23985 [Pseudomonas moraviensis]|uniref:hypothetical protein n=1 Tax=Pseudomonas moraviensis TaxID=321662 RepID=UPI002B31D332|nr:hypothetical protein OE648_23985 [Pseudomonas moraviensis]